MMAERLIQITRHKNNNVNNNINKGIANGRTTVDNFFRVCTGRLNSTVPGGNKVLPELACQHQ